MAMSVVYGTAFGGIISENRGGVVSAYIPDPLGNTIGLMNSGGTLTDSWTYWPYGEVRTRTGSTATPFTFLGMVGYFRDVADKFFYVRARYLRVDLARWQTVDTLWPNQSAYGYVADAPIKFIDPSGTCGNNTDPITNSFCVCANCTWPQFPPDQSNGGQSCCLSQASYAKSIVSDLVGACNTNFWGWMAAAIPLCAFALVLGAAGLIFAAACVVGVVALLMVNHTNCNQLLIDLSNRVIALENQCLHGGYQMGLSQVLNCMNPSSEGGGSGGNGNSGGNGGGGGIFV